MIELDLHTEGKRDTYYTKTQAIRLTLSFVPHSLLWMSNFLLSTHIVHITCVFCHWLSLFWHCSTIHVLPASLIYIFFSNSWWRPSDVILFWPLRSRTDTLPMLPQQIMQSACCWEKNDICLIVIPGAVWIRVEAWLKSCCSEPSWSFAQSGLCTAPASCGNCYDTKGQLI